VSAHHTNTAPYDPRKSSRIGDSVYRVEDDRLLRGRAAFIDDVDAGHGVVHVSFLRSQYAHGIIERLDVTAAKAMPSVIAVLTAADFGHIKPISADFDKPGFKVALRPVLATDRVRFVGDALAMVIATDPYAALDATEAIEVDIGMLPCVTKATAAIFSDAPRLYDHIEDNVIYEGSFESPDFSATHDASEFKLKEKFTAARIAATPIEPRGCIASFQRGTNTLTLWSSTQSPHMVRAVLADHLLLPESDVRVISPDVGGGFGAKTVVYPEEILIAAAAMKLGIPVKWVQDRYDDLLTNAQARDHVYEVEVGFDRTGFVTSLSADILVNIGAYPSLPMGSSLEANGASRNMPGPYRLKNFRYRTRAVATNTCPTGPYRGVAAPLACLAVEGMLDRIARQLNIDPAEVRRRNVIREFPFMNVLGQEYAEGCFSPALERALEAADYEGLRRRQRDNRNENLCYGIGVAVITEQTGMGASRYKARGILRVPGFESAHIKLDTDGTLVASVSQAAIGQGNATAFSQIVSELVGAPLKDIRIVEGDTGRTPAGSGTFASRGITIAGNAVLGAARKVRDKMARIAAHLIECDPGDIRFEDGYAHVAGAKDLRVSLRDVAAAAYSQTEASLPPGESYGIEVIEYYDTPTAIIASMVHVASVIIDKRTGNVKVDRYVVIHDCGRMVNPVLVDGQIQGGIVQGLGEVLMEEIKMGEDGQPFTASLMDYQLPRCVDVMPMQIEAMHSEIGAGILKGVGEGGTIGAVPALTNAIGDALGPAVAVNALPLTAKRIREMLFGQAEQI
jgi:aerobic carbon-monoxide dehydrogenase large subunit